MKLKHRGRNLIHTFRQKPNLHPISHMRKKHRLHGHKHTVFRNLIHIFIVNSILQVDQHKHQEAYEGKRWLCCGVNLDGGLMWLCCFYEARMRRKTRGRPFPEETRTSSKSTDWDQQHSPHICLTNGANQCWSGRRRGHKNNHMWRTDCRSAGWDHKQELALCRRRAAC